MSKDFDPKALQVNNEHVYEYVKSSIMNYIKIDYLMTIRYDLCDPSEWPVEACNTLDVTPMHAFNLDSYIPQPADRLIELHGIEFETLKVCYTQLENIRDTNFDYKNYSCKSVYLTDNLGDDDGTNMFTYGDDLQAVLAKMKKLESLKCTCVGARGISDLFRHLISYYTDEYE